MNLDNVLTVVTAGFGIGAAWLGLRQQGLQHRLAKLEKFCATVYDDNYVDRNIVMLGPRSAGKTSLVTAWTSIWEHISTVDPTPVDFINHEFIYPVYIDERFHDVDIGIYRSKRWRTRAVIWDFVGEERSLNKALEQIKTLSDYIVIFVLSAEAEKFGPNSSYFNTNFLRRAQLAMQDADGYAAECFVVFNKADLIDSRAKTPEADLRSLIAAHEEPVARIRSQFGESRFLLTSAETGEGVGSLLREISELLVDDEGAPKFERRA